MYTNSNQKLNTTFKEKYAIFYGIETVLNCSFSDPVLAELTLGPSEEGTKGLQWKKMMEQPEERIYTWHALDFQI